MSAIVLVFLRLNGIAVDATDDELVELVLGVGTGSSSKSDVAVFFSTHRRAE